MIQPDEIIIDGELQIDIDIDGEIDLDLLIDGEGDLLVPVFPTGYTGLASVTPSKAVQVLPTEMLMMPSDVTIDPIPDEYIIPDGMKEITANGTHDVTEYASVDVDVPVPPGYIIPDGVKDINVNGRHNVTEYAAVDVDVPIPPGYIVPEGTKTINENGTGIDVTEYAAVNVDVVPDPPVLQTKLVSPLESAQQITADTGYDGLGEVDVGAIPSNYVGSSVPRRSGSDLSSNGKRVAVPAGFYSEQQTKDVAEGTEGIPTASKGTVSNHEVTVTPSVQNSEGYISGGTKTGTGVKVTAAELVSGTKQITENGSNIDVTNYEKVNVEVPAGTPNLQTKSVTPTESAQQITADTGYDGLDEVDVAAIDSEYVGSDVPRRSASDLTANGRTVTIPKGYYGSQVTKQVQQGIEGAPSASKGQVSNHKVTVTPSVSNSEGYISGGTKTGTGVEVTAAELVSGKKTINQNGTDIDVANYEKVDVVVPAGTPTLQTKSVTPTESAQQITADTGYDGLGEVDVAAIDSEYVGSDVPRRSESDLSASGRTVTVPEGYYGAQVTKQVQQGTAGTPTASKGAVSNHEVTITPSVQNSEGYISGGTKTGTGVKVTAAELVSGSETKTENGTYDVTNLEELVVNVSSGSSKNVQVVQGTTRTTSSTLTAIGAEMTVSKTGTYDIYWSAFRSNTSSSYTYATRLYIDGTAYGSEQTTWSYHCQNVHLSNVSLTAGQKIRVYGRESRGSSYYIYAPTLVIVEN